MSYYSRKHYLRKWSEEDHPRAPAGDSDGGQFVSDGGGGSDLAAADHELQGQRHVDARYQEALGGGYPPEEMPVAITVDGKTWTVSGHRPLGDIARDIRRDWGGKTNFAAKPYLEALGALNDIKDSYGADSAKSVVAYFLSNATSWRGEKAREIKAELKDILKR